ncbi:hypothetical protein, partial [Aeromonas veronii]
GLMDKGGNICPLRFSTTSTVSLRNNRYAEKHREPRFTATYMNHNRPSQVANFRFRADLKGVMVMIALNMGHLDQIQSCPIAKIWAK